MQQITIFHTDNDKENKKFGPYNLMNENKKKTEVQFIDCYEMELLKNCSLQHLNVSTDVNFYVQTNNSMSHSIITYYRFDKKTIEQYDFHTTRYVVVEEGKL